MVEECIPCGNYKEYIIPYRYYKEYIPYSIYIYRILVLRVTIVIIRRIVIWEFP